MSLDPNSCPPKAEVRASNPLGRANEIKELFKNPAALNSDLASR